VFATVPEIKSGRVILLEGPILLASGHHWGPNRGFGAAHIWAEHAKEMAKAGFGSSEEVPHYVSQIVRLGTPLFFEGSQINRTRLLAVRSSAGTAILELRQQRDGAIWSVVTAFSGTKTHGTRVGTVR
jgi:hypothetical protein